MAVGEKQIQQAIVVIVEKSCSPAEKRNGGIRNSGRIAHIREAGIPVISVERVVVIRKIGDAEVDAPVSVVIAYRNPHRCLFAAFIVKRKSRKIADVLECAVVLVAVKILWDRIVGDQQIRPAIVVYIHEDDDGWPDLLVANDS